MDTTVILDSPGFFYQMFERFDPNMRKDVVKIHEYKTLTEKTFSPGYFLKDGTSADALIVSWDTKYDYYPRRLANRNCLIEVFNKSKESCAVSIFRIVNQKYVEFFTLFIDPGEFVSVSPSNYLFFIPLYNQKQNSGEIVGLYDSAQVNLSKPGNNYWSAYYSSLEDSLNTDSTFLPSDPLEETKSPEVGHKYIFQMFNSFSKQGKANEYDERSQAGDDRDSS